MADNQIDLAITRDSDTGNPSEPSFSGILSFARRRYSKNLSGADIAVVGLPFDLATTSRPGARLGPRAIREASAMIAWDRVHGWDYDPFERVSVVDAGDIRIDATEPQRLPAKISGAFDDIYQQNVQTLMLGGDHFATYPVLNALREHVDRPISLIHFDAHSDTWGEGEPQGLDHGTMFYHAAREGLIDPQYSVQIGLRTYNPKSHGFHILTAEQVCARPVEEAVAWVKSIVGDRPAYLTFDIDCLDPAYAPGTGTPVIGGLTSLQAQQLLRGLRGCNIISGDVVEVAPAYDSAQITALAAATIGVNLIALMSAAPRYHRRSQPGQ